MSTGAGADDVAALGTMTSSWASALPGTYATLGVTANRDAKVAAHASGSDCPEAPEACASTAWDAAAAINKAPTPSLARGKALKRDMDVNHTVELDGQYCTLLCPVPLAALRIV